MPTDVLVVDDDANLRTFLAGLLEAEGYTVLQASDGRPALDRLRHHPTELVVLLDLHMPMMSGIEVLRVVEAEVPLSTRHAYLVLSSAQSDELPPDFLLLLERHHIPLFAKPCPLDELVAAVAAAAERLEGSARDERGRPEGEKAR
jgi:CheY-like chemotaxis protein